MSRVVPNWYGKILCNCGEVVETEIVEKDLADAAATSMHLVQSHEHETNPRAEHFPVTALFKKVK